VAYSKVKLINLPKDSEIGEWSYIVDYDSKKYIHNFYVSLGKRESKESPMAIENIENILLKVPGEPINGNDYTCINNEVYFDHDIDTLNTITKNIIIRMAKYLISKDLHDVKITGYTSSVGSESYNLNLSKKRAYNVKKLFEELGIRKVSFKGRGEEELIYDEWGRELEYQSRRVKICYRK